MGREVMLDRHKAFNTLQPLKETCSPITNLKYQSVYDTYIKFLVNSKPKRRAK